jgi:hypothetical protein
MIRPGLEPTTCRTRSEHANHYTTDAVYLIGQNSIIFIRIFFFKIQYILNTELRRVQHDTTTLSQQGFPPVPFLLQLSRKNTYNMRTYGKYHA